MSTLRAAAERALEEMRGVWRVGLTGHNVYTFEAALEGLRAALAAEQPQSEAEFDGLAWARKFAEFDPPAPAEQPQPARIDPMQNPLRPTLAKLGPPDEHPAEEVLRRLAYWLGVGGYNAPTVDADLFHRKIVDGIEMLLASAAPPAAPPEQPQPEAPSGWIACDERMPEAGVEVLVWLAAPAFKGSSNVAMDTWDEQHEAPVAWSSATLPIGMGWDSGTDWERITHWMPLPAAPGAAPPPSAPQAEAPSQFARGIDAAARFAEKRLADYDAEHGSTDPDTGTREYPGTGDEYACELAEIAEAIRALAPPPSAPEPSEADFEHDVWAKEFAEWEQHWRESARAEGLTDTIKAFREGEAEAARFFADAMRRAAAAARNNNPA